MIRPKVEIFTDGACSGNPGPGGYGAVLKFGEIEKCISGGCPETTNNKMELLAAIEALNSLKKPCDVTLYTDSKYLVDSINEKWVFNWKANGWKRSGNKMALNIDLWEKILSLIKIHNVTFVWVKGHAGHPENERCDKMAVNEYQKYLNK